MALTPNELSRIDDYVNGIGDRPEPVARFGQQVANIAPEMVTGGLQLLQNVADPARNPKITPTFGVSNFYNPPQAKTTSEQAADLGAGLINAGIQFALPEVLGVQGAAARMSLGNAALTMQSDPTPQGVGLAALTGGVLGLTTNLPIGQRLAASAGIGGLAAMTTGDIGQVPNAMMLNFFGRHGEVKEKPTVPGTAPIDIKPLSTAYDVAHQQMQAESNGLGDIIPIQSETKPFMQGLTPEQITALQTKAERVQKIAETGQPIGSNPTINVQLDQVLKGVEPGLEPKPTLVAEPVAPVEPSSIRLTPVTEPLPTPEVATLQESAAPKVEDTATLTNAQQESVAAKTEEPATIQPNPVPVLSEPKYSTIEGESPMTQKAQDIHNLVQDKIKNWKNAPEINVEQSAPADTPNASGKYENGKVTLYADNIKDSNHAMETLLHEVDGHYGLQGILGDHYAAAMDRAGANIAPNRLTEIKTAYKLDPNNIDHHRFAIEEYLARKAANNSLPTKLLGAVKDGLNKLGFQFKDDFVRKLLADSRKYVRDGSDILASSQAKDLGIIHNGIQKGIPGEIPDHNLFTDTKTGTTFSAPVGAATDIVDSALQGKRELFSNSEANTTPAGARYSRPLPSDEQKTQLIATLQKFAPALAGATAGGIWSATSEGKVSMAQGILAGALFGAYGPKVVTHLFGENPSSLLSDIARHSKGMKPLDALKAAFDKNAWNRLGEEGSILSKQDAVTHFVRWFEKNLHQNLPTEIRDALLKATGEGSLAIKSAHEALAKMDTLKVDPAWQVATDNFYANKLSEADYRSQLGTSEQAKTYADFSTTAKSAVATLQQMLYDGLHEGKFKQVMARSIKEGDYLTQAYRLFTDPEFKPSAESIAAVQAELKARYPDVAGDISAQELTSYYEDVKRGKGFYQGASTQKAQIIDSAIFKSQKDLSPAFKEFLGEIKDPQERMLITLRKLLPSAISSKFTDLLASGAKDTQGLKLAMPREELNSLIEELKGKGDPDSLKKLATLQSYLAIDGNPKYGRLGGMHASRFVSDHLQTHDTIFDDHGNAIMGALQRFQSQVKLQHTALNPFMHIQNILGAPVLGFIGRADIAGYKKAWAMLRQGASHPDFKEATLNGIFDANYVKGELLKDAGNILKAKSPNTVQAMFEKFRDRSLELHQLPDILTRAASYFSARARAAADMGLPETDARVINAARLHTDRYCPNFAQVAPAIKTLRKTPFVNMYITYAAELTRVTKNLVMDVMDSSVPSAQRVHSAKALGGLFALPILAEHMSTAALSPKDQDEWKRTVENMPDYARNRNRIVTGRNADGSFNFIDITRYNQVDHLSQMMRTIMNGDWKAFISTNPLMGLDNTVALSIAASQISGIDTHTKQPVSGLTGRVQEIMRESLSPIFPGNSEATKIVNSFSPNATGALGLANPVSGQSNTPSQMIATYLTGLRFSTVQPAHLVQQVVNQAQRQMADEGKYYKDIINSNVPTEQKQLAAQRLGAMQQRVMKDLGDRLGGQPKNRL